MLCCLALAVPAALAASCGGGGDDDAPEGPQVGVKGEEAEAATDLGFPAFATKNTTRVGSADPVATAAAVARAVYPGAGLEDGRRPAAVALADASDWRAALAAAPLIADPVGAPVLFADGDDLPDATKDTISALGPTGAKDLANARVIRVGDVPEVEGLESTDITGENPADLAARVDATLSAANGRTSDRVLVVTSERPELAVPAAGWAAKSGDPILFTGRDDVPRATIEALERHEQPRIHLFGDDQTITAKVERRLRRLGTVRRIEGSTDPVANAIDFARHVDGTFGWGVVDPGHGLVFVNARRPVDAIAAAPLSRSGTYGPILLHTGGARLDRRLESYLLDIQPGYERDPVRGVYNHGWVIGDEDAMPVAVQSRIDALLEITQVQASPAPTS